MNMYVDNKMNLNISLPKSTRMKGPREIRTFYNHIVVSAVLKGGALKREH